MAQNCSSSMGMEVKGRQVASEQARATGLKLIPLSWMLPALVQPIP